MGCFSDVLKDYKVYGAALVLHLVRSTLELLRRAVRVIISRIFSRCGFPIHTSGGVTKNRPVKRIYKNGQSPRGTGGISCARIETRSLDGGFRPVWGSVILRSVGWVGFGVGGYRWRADSSPWWAVYRGIEILSRAFRRRLPLRLYARGR